jgi:hypothetical protein
MRMARLLILAACLLCVPSSRAEPLAPPTVAFGTSTVTATHLEPGAQVVFFAVGLVPDGYESTVVRWSAIVSDTTKTGAVTFDAEAEIPCKSAWVVADIATGAYTVAAPPGCPLRHGTIDPASLQKNLRQEVDGFRANHPIWTFSS